jgi:hypothetical protein
MRIPWLIPVLLCLCLLSSLPFPARALDDLVITEFMAENSSILNDDDGDSSDWIEIYNAGTNTVNLNGWYLTDTQGSLGWRFPATNMPVNSFILVFASGKNRRIPGRPLHTDFKLNDTGEYLALLKPDGSVQSAYAPTYPLQVPDISYGVPVTLSTSTLLAGGAAGRFTVPLNGLLGLNWTQIGFNDGSWASVNNGVGFEADAPVAGSPTIIADSAAEFSGTQGQNGWFYGYWDKKADANGTYESADFTPFPRGTGNVLAPTNYWDGGKWNWPAGDPPWTELTSGGGHPNADNGNPALPIHWAIRRYVTESAGPLRISGILACNSVNGTCGDGTVGHIFVNGVEVFTRAVKYSSEGYSIAVSANLGSTIDFAIDPGPGNNDFCDSTTFTAVIRTAAGAAVVADTVADWSVSGTQGEKNWSYGYFNATTGGAYATAKFTPFPSAAGPYSSVNFWNGEAWKWFQGDPPFDTIGQIESRPNVFTTGGTNAHQHWVIRRWLSEVSGTIHVDWHVAKKDLTGGGVTASIYQNGTQRDTYVLGGADFVGTNRTVVINNVQVGDAIDFAIAAGTDIIGDLCFLNATIHGSGTLAGQFTSDVGNLMSNINASAYLRLPFTMADVSGINGLTLRVKYDDGFAAYLNGTLVASANAPEILDWNSAATSSRPDTDASQFQEFDLGQWKDFLVSGPNVLAIQGLNASPTDPDFLVSVQLLTTRASFDFNNKRYFTGPTPGSINGVGTTTIGPLLSSIRHSPAEPADAEDLVVTARIASTLNPVASVNLYYRVMYGAETSLAMADDGLHGDGVAGDGIYGAIIPNSAYTPGQMVRYYFIASDTLNNQSRQPPIGDTNNSSLYFGTVVKDPSLSNQLAVLHWFTQTPVTSTTFQKISMYWLGEFYDNIKMNTHGQSSGGFPNHSFNVDFNPDHNFKWAEGEKRVDDINLLSSYADKAHMRLILSYQIYKDSGPRAPYHFCVPARMQSNGVFHSVMHITENGDDKYLKRLGRDPNGAMYKMYTDPSQPANAEKKTRRWEDKSDFTTFVAGINSPTNRVYLYDNLDMSETINFFAAMIVTASVDCCHKNFYLYRDSDGDGEWEMLPWDLDLSFGRNWQSGETYWDDRVYPNNGLFVGGTFPLGPFLFNNQPFRSMYLRRVRTLQDQMLQTNGTPYTQLNFEQQIDYWTALMKNDGALDLAKWGTWGMGNGGAGGSTGGTRIDSTNTICQRTGEPSVPCWRTLQDAAAEMKTNYMARRRTYVFNQFMGLGGTDRINFTNPQPDNATIVIGAIDYNPSSGNQNEEYIQLVNTNNYAVDISGWQLAGAVEHTFQAGVVIPSGGAPTNVLYVVPNKKAFRQRAVSPRGGQGLYVEGPYKGQLSARGETIVLVDRQGRTNQTLHYNGIPSGVQRYLRVTEVMYHPPLPPAGSLFTAEDFEYIELRNTGPTNLNLTGVQFVNGVEFNFTGSAVTTLAPGQYVLVVKSLAAFTSRYGGGFNIAGEFAGALENGGENIQLKDSVGENIHDFSYHNEWYPITDGPGASLVIVDENADESLWSDKSNWRPSVSEIGSPGQTDPTPGPAPVPVIINELLTHTDLPQVDAIELLNPTATEADISGWFLSDDFSDPKKFRVPANTRISPGGYLVFYETNSFGSTNTSITTRPFAISSKGDETYLYSGNGTNLTGYLQGYSFGAAANGVSFGRYTNSQTNVHFVAQSALTLGAANSLPKVGPVVISEINYHPDVGSDVDEFIELANITGGDVPLYDPSNPANTWHLRSAVDFDFPANLTLASGEHLLVVSFNPADSALFNTFTSRFSVPASVRVLGPWQGQLDNTGESIRLYRPDTPETGDVPYVLIDQVDYSNQSPWTTAADGLGLSLQRLVETAYGNDPTNWTGAAPAAGAGYVAGGTPPSITSQPQSLTLIAGRTATFSVGVNGTPPFQYRWRFNGTTLVGTGPELILPNVQDENAGSYNVTVFNSAASVVSGNAVLTVVHPPRISQQPTNRAVWIKPDPRAVNTPEGTNVTFFVGATSGNSALRYQWVFYGTNFPGATNASLTITNVQVKDEGDYFCFVTDTVDTVMSAIAHLTPLIQPIVLQPPLGQTVVEGSDFSHSVEIVGNPAPFGYSWRRALPAGTIASNYVSSRSNFITVNSTAAGLVLANGITSSNYELRLVIFNEANLSPGVLIRFTNTVVADFDRDGIPDVVENSLGLSPTDPADGNGDLDHDGMSNKAEYIAGTDPANPASYLKITSITAGGGATLTFGAVSNKTYTIQYTEGLGGGVWTKLKDVFARSTNRTETVFDPNSTTNRYYRVATPFVP